ncbi:MAG: hypothetical protein ACRDZZ_06370 [Ilumatobacteraceae bacterium]
MSVVSTLKARARGDDIQALRDELGSVRDMVASINHRMGEIERVVETLNHDVRSGAGDVLPLFLGYAERFRTDADTMVGVTELVDRQLAAITEQVERLVAVAERRPGTGAAGAAADET